MVQVAEPWQRCQGTWTWNLRLVERNAAQILSNTCTKLGQGGHCDCDFAASQNAVAHNIQSFSKRCSDVTWAPSPPPDDIRTKSKQVWSELVIMGKKICSIPISPALILILWIIQTIESFIIESHALNWWQITTIPQRVTSPPFPQAPLLFRSACFILVMMYAQGYWSWQGKLHEVSGPRLINDDFSPGIVLGVGGREGSRSCKT